MVVISHIPGGHSSRRRPPCSIPCTGRPPASLPGQARLRSQLGPGGHSCWSSLDFSGFAPPVLQLPWVSVPSGPPHCAESVLPKEFTSLELYGGCQVLSEDAWNRVGSRHLSVVVHKELLCRRYSINIAEGRGVQRGGRRKNKVRTQQDAPGCCEIVLLPVPGTEWILK